MADAPPLPAGFQLEAAPTAAPVMPPLPAGFQDEQGPAAPAPTDNLLQQGMSGVNEGIARGLGAPVDLATLGINKGIEGINALFNTQVPEIRHPMGGSETFTGLLAPTIKPVSADPTQQVVRRIGQELGANAIPMGGIAARAEAPISSLVSQIATTLGAGTGAAIADQAVPNNPWADLAGEILGGASVGGVAGAARKIITPNPTDPQRLIAAAEMRRNGIDLTAGQVTGSKPLKYAEAELGGERAAAVMDRQSEQFTSAALSHAGINASRATPDVVDGAFTNLGHEFDGLAQRNQLVPDRQLSTDLSGIVRDYNSLVPEHSRAPIVNNVLTDIVGAVRNNGVIDGAAYQALRSRLDKAARSSLRSDPNLSDALFGIRNSLDDTMERSLAQNNSNDLGAWREVRGQYRNLLVIEKAATSAGENSALGLISPQALRQATVSMGRRAYARGNGDFADLSRSGVATMSPLPQSGTAPRIAARSMWANAPSAIGAVAGGSIGNLPGAALGFALGHAAPALVGKAIMSRMGQGYLRNQVASGALLDSTSRLAPVTAAIVNQANQQQPLQITVN